MKTEKERRKLQKRHVCRHFYLETNVAFLSVDNNNNNVDNFDSIASNQDYLFYKFIACKCVVRYPLRGNGMQNLNEIDLRNKSKLSNSMDHIVRNKRSNWTNTHVSFLTLAHFILLSTSHSLSHSRQITDTNISTMYSARQPNTTIKKFWSRFSVHQEMRKLLLKSKRCGRLVDAYRRTKSQTTFAQCHWPIFHTLSNAQNETTVSITIFRLKFSFSLQFLLTHSSDHCCALRPMSTSNEVQLIKSAPHAAATTKFLLIHNVHEILRKELTNAYDDSWLDTICMSLVCTQQRFRFSTTKLCTIQSNKHDLELITYILCETIDLFQSSPVTYILISLLICFLFFLFSFLSLRLNRYFFSFFEYSTDTNKHYTLLQ